MKYKIIIIILGLIFLQNLTYCLYINKSNNIINRNYSSGSNYGAGVSDEYYKLVIQQAQSNSISNILGTDSDSSSSGSSNEYLSNYLNSSSSSSTSTDTTTLTALIHASLANSYLGKNITITNQIGVNIAKGKVTAVRLDNKTYTVKIEIDDKTWVTLSDMTINKWILLIE